MKKLFRFSAVFLLLLLLAVPWCKPTPGDFSSYSLVGGMELSYLTDNGEGICRVFESRDVTIDLLENRMGTVIIERCVGVVLNEAGDGRVLNGGKDMGDYIAYRRLGFPVSAGDIIVTYLVFNPENNYCDDIVARFDFPTGDTYGNL